MAIGADSNIDFFGTQDVVDDTSTSTIANNAFSVAADIAEWTNTDVAPMANFVLECQFDTTAPVTNMDIETLMVAASSSWSIAVGSWATWSGSNAFVTDFSWNLPTEELATGSFTLKITGDIGTSNT